MMPFSQDPGTQEDSRYCSFCFSGGELHAEHMNLKSFKLKAYEGMRKRGMNIIMAKIFTYFIGFSPYWRARKKGS